MEWDVIGVLVGLGIMNVCTHSIMLFRTNKLLERVELLERAFYELSVVPQTK